MPAYDRNNIFAKIVRGELPCYKIYEDDKALAFLDIMPRASGHALVLPKAPARNILDASPDDLAHVMKVAQKIAKASVEVFGADGVTIQQFNESAGGQVVFHLHVHVIPRKAGVTLKPPPSVKEAPEVLAERAKQLAAADQRDPLPNGQRVALPQLDGGVAAHDPLAVGGVQMDGNAAEGTAPFHHAGVIMRVRDGDGGEAADPFHQIDRCSIDEGNA